MRVRDEVPVALLSAIDPDLPLDAVVLFKDTGTQLALWTRNPTPPDVVPVMASTLLASAESVLESIGDERPRTVTVETDRNGKAVQLTEMANRVWKRSAEYALIVAERRRLRAAVEGRERLAEHVAVVPFAVEGEAERGGGVGPPLLRGVTDHPRQDDVDLLHLAGGGALEVLARRGDGAHRLQVVERVDGLGARGLEEELRDVGPVLLERPEAVGDVAAVRVGLAGERYLKVRLGPRQAPLGHRAPLYPTRAPWYVPRP